MYTDFLFKCIYIYDTYFRFYIDVLINLRSYSSVVYKYFD